MDTERKQKGWRCWRVIRGAGGYEEEEEEEGLPQRRRRHPGIFVSKAQMHLRDYRQELRVIAIN